MFTMKTLVIVFTFFTFSFAAAKPAEQYSRQQTRYVNHLKETSTGAALLDQDFKRYSAKAVFSDGEKSYILYVYRILDGDLFNFLVLAKTVDQTGKDLPLGTTAQLAIVRGFHLTEAKTIEETNLKAISTSVPLEDGSIKTSYESDSYSKNAYSVAKSKNWSINGSLTETNFFNMNEQVQSDTTITDVHQTTYSLPITLDAFRAYLPNKVRRFFETFRALHLRAVELNEQIKSCKENCDELQARWSSFDVLRERIWTSIVKDDVEEMKPVKPKAMVRVQPSTSSHNTAADPEFRSRFNQLWQR